VEGIAMLPVALIKQRFAEAFPEIDDGLSSLSWRQDAGSFQVTWPPNPTNAIFVHCSWDLLKAPEVMNRIVDVANEFGCALYDPQNDTRYEQPSGDGGS
jgi:hypothetical protein